MASNDLGRNMSDASNFIAQFIEGFPGHFDQFHVSGFRRLRDVSLELRPFCVLIGANGVGKTSVLDAISLLSASAEGGLQRAIHRLGGFQAILTSLGAADRISDMTFGLTQVQDHVGRSWTYSLRMQPVGPSYAIEEEQLSGTSAGGSPVEFIHTRFQSAWLLEDETEKPIQIEKKNNAETALSLLSPKDEAPWDFRVHLASSSSYHALDVSERSPVRMPQQLQSANLPGKDGEDLVSCLFNMRESHRHRFEAVEDAMRAAFPSFERLEFSLVEDGTLAMAWRDAKLGRQLSMHQLSEGTLRFLWLATLLQSPGLPAITLIDEPEVSLHPELLSLLADLMREASLRTQLVVATHADRFVRFLKPEEVVAMDIEEDGSVSAKWGDTLDLDEWLKDYTLDEVWQMGRMGGRS